MPFSLDAGICVCLVLSGNLTNANQWTHVKDIFDNSLQRKTWLKIADYTI